MGSEKIVYKKKKRDKRDENINNEESIDISSYSKKGKRRKKKKKTVILAVIAIVLVLALLVGWFFIKFRYNYNNKFPKDHDDLGISEVINKDIVNIALFGLDTRKVGDFKGLSDSIMILSINTKTNTIKLISIMRDSLVPIDGQKAKAAKINSAYGSGGPTLAVKTINKLFGLDISNYITVNFFGMEDIIDAVGGIEIPVSEAEMEYYLNQCIREQSDAAGVKPEYVEHAGTQVLNGRQAVAWARIRKVANVWGHTDDFGRTERQRYVMQQLFASAKGLKKSKYVSLAEALIPCTETSLDYKEILSLAMLLTKGEIKMETERVPSDKMIINADYRASGASAVYYNIEDAKNLIHAVIYENMTTEQYEETHTYTKADWYGGTSNKTQSSTSSKSSTASSAASSSGTSRSQSVDKPSDSGNTVNNNNSGNNSSTAASSSQVSSSQISSEPSSSSSQSSSGSSSSTPEPGGDEPTTPEEPTTEE